MGTRADFYVGRGPDSEWIGSIAWDGGQVFGEDINPELPNEKAFRDDVAAFFAERDDATLPEMGWPWPWNDSNLTDCIYAWDDGVIWTQWNDYPDPGVWVPVTRERVYDEDAEEYIPAPDGLMPCVFPDMSDIKAVTLGPRSGVIVFGGAKD